MSTLRCTVTGCLSRIRCSGLCKVHYSRWLRHGSTEARRRPRSESTSPLSFGLRTADLTPLLGTHPLVAQTLALAEASDLSQRQIAERAGVSSLLLHKWANGHTPTVANLANILEVLGYELRIVQRGSMVEGAEFIPRGASRAVRRTVEARART